MDICKSCIRGNLFLSVACNLCRTGSTWRALFVKITAGKDRGIQEGCINVKQKWRKEERGDVSNYVSSITN